MIYSFISSSIFFHSRHHHHNLLIHFDFLSLKFNQLCLINGSDVKTQLIDWSSWVVCMQLANFFYYYCPNLCLPMHTRLTNHMSSLVSFGRVRENLHARVEFTAEPRRRKCHEDLFQMKISDRRGREKKCLRQTSCDGNNSSQL